MDVWDLRLDAGGRSEFTLPAGRTLALIVLKGTVLVNAETIAREGQLVVLAREGEDLALEANNTASVLLLSGEPIEEPIAGYGPFVMNTQAEIRQAMLDFNSGRFGEIPR
jgi:redox-sensitive bicupin YhaK (pirin superfamily)